MLEPPGTGPGQITDDGCAVDLYAQLPAMGEARIVHAALAQGATVLDLGSGTGRIAHGLIELGHEVVAVDQSADMLAYVRGADVVRATIAGLDLGKTFDGVLLSSHLFNTADDCARHAIVSAASRHVADDGRLVVQWHTPDWLDRAADGGGGVAGNVRIELSDVHRDGDLLSATVLYWAGEDVWTQTFTARRISEAGLHSELAAVGLAFDGWLTPDHAWFAARPGR